MSKVIEIPVGKRTFRYRFFEIFPGLVSIGIMVLLVVLSAWTPIAGSIFLLVIVIGSVVKAIGVMFRTVQGYKTVKAGCAIDWRKRMIDLEDPQESYERLAHSKSKAYDHQQHLYNLCQMAAEPQNYPNPTDIFHAVIITMYNETLDVLAPTLDSVAASTFPKDHMIVVLAYEERGGPAAERVAKTLERNYGKKFYDFVLSKHPDGLPNEVIGKGGNITYAGKMLKKYVQEKGIKYKNVIVTTLDCDNRPHECYFDQVAYEYIVHEERTRMSFQPVSLFTNNIWDAPAVTRVVACTNSFWNLVCTMRPLDLRNFASHSQPLDALVGMNFWSVRTIVEDGHQYWRSLFYFDGDYEVYPIRAPIYQDAVLSNTLLKTLKAQWVQLRRWDYGASDVAYVADYMFSKKRKMKFVDLWLKFVRLLDGHVTLASTAPIVLLGGWVPLLFNFESRNLLAHNLPTIVSYIQTFAMLLMIVSITLSMKMLPPKPKRYHNTRRVMMVLQWIISPVIAVVYTSLCAFYSQIRLMLGLYMEKFDVTDKAVKK
ncbi:glycosyltransferase family 2 protein [Candidatus Saccharibacteria bacterium]|nr:glycosyltransferase family 2 protein [Candidatus Saccharibacteria bacterium]